MGGGGALTRILMRGQGGRRGLSVRSNIVQSATSRDNFQQQASSGEVNV